MLMRGSEKSSSTGRQTRVRSRSWIMGVSALFSGVALLTNIIGGISLRLALLIALFLPVFAFGTAWSKMTPDGRHKTVARLKVGLMAGLLATIAYDLTRFTFYRWDTSPYNPFEVIRVFGSLIVGTSAKPVVLYTAGAAFHALNGLCFAVAYWFLFGRYGVPAAIVWALFLELFQLTLYPGWLNIKFYREFLQISASSHVSYGVVLGFGCQWLQRRIPQ